MTDKLSQADADYLAGELTAGERKALWQAVDTHMRAWIILGDVAHGIMRSHRFTVAGLSQAALVDAGLRLARSDVQIREPSDAEALLAALHELL